MKSNLENIFSRCIWPLKMQQLSMSYSIVQKKIRNFQIYL